MMTEVRAVPLNAQLPILVTLWGILTEARLEHCSNALSPILVTLLGMLTEARLEHCSNALCPILVTP
jgi:hypothetical protein